MAFAEHRLSLLLLAATLLFWAGLVALVLNDARLPPQASGTVVAVFPRATPRARMFEAVLQADGRLVRETWFANIWVVSSNTSGFVGRLRAAGVKTAFKPALFEPVAMVSCFGVPALSTRTDR